MTSQLSKDTNKKYSPPLDVFIFLLLLQINIGQKSLTKNDKQKTFNL